jgi:hypothetical protein
LRWHEFPAPYIDHQRPGFRRYIKFFQSTAAATFLSKAPASKALGLGSGFESVRIASATASFLKASLTQEHDGFILQPMFSRTVSKATGFAVGESCQSQISA